ncbi:hypothetical protein EHS13_28610 [Paenibacillus psychroresistens]|uniref:Damage-inducible protein DinB n=1 Tax=Paenibacillus psychroresistens TaxID=1778678 RepID=A0A6B8RTL6_9BACL|nr:DinB family protein [Paenibacillus psychroresistens]QGQ98558.1 hypothetical protein EHS13_28610 [Paenibacillus psychroresistens]
MFMTINDFVSSWTQESTGTQRVLNTLTDASLLQQIAPNHRKLGQLAWHITTTVHEMMSRTGLEFPEPAGGELAPDSAALIAAEYNRASQGLILAIQSQWTDASLLQKTNMYGEDWLNGLTLRILCSHEIHHRGQITVVMRQAGLRVPELYGPAREDWIELGMEPHI